MEPDLLLGVVDPDSTGLVPKFDSTELIPDPDSTDELLLVGSTGLVPGLLAPLVPGSEVLFEEVWPPSHLPLRHHSSSSLPPEGHRLCKGAEALRRRHHCQMTFSCHSPPRYLP